jgi:hypothetical protein
MNTQEIYDTVKEHMLKQNARSVIIRPSLWTGEPYEACKYRDNDGRKCAVGCLIKDEFYHPSMEGSLANALPMLVKSGVAVEEGDTTYEFLLDLQRTHDGSNVENWKIALEEVAMRYSLKP